LSKLLKHIIGDWLQRLADGEPHEIGEVGPRHPYSHSNRQRIGPEVAKLHREGLIEVADAVRSARATRRNSIARRWRAVDPDACRRYAAKLLGQGDGDSGWTQPCLF